MTDYRLHVDMLVTAEKAQAFEATMSLFLSTGAFRAFSEAFDNELVVALKAKHPFDYTPGAGRGHPQRATRSRASRFLSTGPYYEDRINTSAPVQVYRYVHLWTIPHEDDLDLAKRMLYCSENELYMKLDSLVLLENQDLVRRVRWQDPIRKLNGDAPFRTFVRAIRQLDYSCLGKYLFAVKALVPELERRGWYEFGQFQNITGSLNTVTEFWGTDDGSSLADMFPPVPRARGAKPGALCRGLRDFAGGARDLPVSVTLESFTEASYFRSWRPTFATLRADFETRLKQKQGQRRGVSP
jgi:hypothetical protein